MKQFLPLIILFVLLAGCKALGTKTLFKNTTVEHPQKLGFAKLDNDTITLKLFPKADSIFNIAMKETCQKYNSREIFATNMPLSTTNPDTNSIAEICRREQLDGLITTKIKFIHVTYSIYFIPIAKNWDTEVDMFLYNREGKLLLCVRHNTFHGNSYLIPPSADRTIHDGTEGVVKRVAKELGWVKLTQ